MDFMSTEGGKCMGIKMNVELMPIINQPQCYCVMQQALRVAGLFHSPAFIFCDNAHIRWKYVYHTFNTDNENIVPSDCPAHVIRYGMKCCIVVIESLGIRTFNNLAF